MADSLYEGNWIELPNIHQKYFIIMIKMAKTNFLSCCEFDNAKLGDIFQSKFDLISQMNNIWLD